jgi:uroporphyrinogen-III synthase
MSSLKGKHILVTREAKGAAQFAEKITAYGGKPVIAPLLAISCLPVSDQAASSIEGQVFDWVFFTSKNGVDCFFQMEDAAVILAHSKIAAVGPKTAQAIKQQGYPTDFMPTIYNAEVMAEEFLAKNRETGPVLLVRGTLASPVLPEAFKKAGIPFKRLEVYETAVNVLGKDKLNEVLSRKQIDYLTFTSPSAVNAFFELAETPERFLELPAACIGTTTEKQAKRMGLEKTIVPKHFTTEAMIQVMSEQLKKEGC